jgi:thiamine biosynthesis lipoprotein
MGTACVVGVTVEQADKEPASRALAAARREVTDCERALSRFDPRSDLWRLNGAGGSWIPVDERLVEALTAAIVARADTDGRFDPTILPALAAAGYDRSFELLGDREATPVEGWRAGSRIEVDRQDGTARLEEGASVDLGGIGKGFAASRAIGAMRAAWPGLKGGLVDLGGDIAVWGTPPEGGPWRVDIADSRGNAGPVGTLELEGGGVATSGRNTRRFGPGGRLHHLIDPATGVPASAGPISVTVVAPTATEAEAHATAFAVSDIEQARDQLAGRPDLSALVIPQRGEPIVIGALPIVRRRPRARFMVTARGGQFQ